VPFTSKLVAAYGNAEYVVFCASGPLALRVGEPGPRLDALPESARAESAASLLFALAVELENANYSRCPAEGRGCC
jgi:hypothetical protein